MRLLVLLLGLLFASAAVAQDAPTEDAASAGDDDDSAGDDDDSAGDDDDSAGDDDDSAGDEAVEEPAIEPMPAVTWEAAAEAAAFWRERDQLHLAEEALEVGLDSDGPDELRVDLAEVAIAQERAHAARWILSQVDLKAAPDLAERVAELKKKLPAASKRRGLQAAYQLRKAGNDDEAEWALFAGKLPTQQRALELGYLAVAQERFPRAKAYFADAASGDDEAMAEVAAKELAVQPQMVAGEQLQEAAALRAEGKLEEAEALLMALLPVENGQLVALELAYLAFAADLPAKGRIWLVRAMGGSDEALAETAREQYESMPDLVIQRALEAGWKLKAEGQCDLALEAFQAALAAGADEQPVQLEIAYSHMCAGDPAGARQPLQAAAGGSDPELAAVAQELLARQYLADAAAERGAEDYEQAAISLDMAEASGVAECAVYLERGYLAKAEEDLRAARSWFVEAKNCDDEDVSATARAELRQGWRLFWGDIYAELYGWHRFYPTAYRNTNLVPTLRVRGYIHPIPKVDLDPYVFFRISRDFASRSVGPNGYPLIFADNTLMFGVGVLFRFWERRVGLFAQIGPAINLLNDNRPRVALDARAGAFFSAAVPKCAPDHQLEEPGVRVGFEGCAEAYAEAVWVSRFDNNVFTMGRGRLAFTFLVTGPVAWQPIVEGRVLKDINNDYYNNLIDAGAGFRWRLLTPIGVDLMIGVHGGTYFGLENRSLAPSPLNYAELRLQAATYIAF